MNTSRHDNRLRPRRGALLVGAILLSTFSLSPIAAMGPSLPLQIDMDEERGAVVLWVDVAQIGDFVASRQLYRDGELVRRDEIPLQLRELEKSDRHTKGEKWLASQIALEELAAKLTDLDPGAYAERLVIEGVWQTETRSKLREERWVHYVVDKSGVRPVTLREYSNLVDKPEIAIDASGRKSLVCLGRGPKEEVPIQETKHVYDVALGRLGGVAEEKTESRERQERDSSEKEEN